MARQTEFQTIRSEGGLLPPDLRRRVLDPREKLDGTRSEDYGLPQSERLNEAITQSWNRLRKHWEEFHSAVANLPASEAGTGLTNDKWSLPLLRELGFGLLPTSAGPAINGRTYPISRFFGPVPIHLVGCGLSLDHRTAGVRGAAAGNPHGLVQEFLNRNGSGHLWGIVSNGLRFRVLRDNQALSRQSFLEFDLEAMFTGEVYSDFVVLWLLAHATRFVTREDNRADTCWLEQWTKIANEQGTRALGDLRGGVERALQTLGEGFTGHPKNTALRDALRTGQVPLADFHGQLLRLVYRLIFLFVAEDRTIDGCSLLHPRDDSGAAQIARERYAAHYSTARLRDMSAQIKGSRHGDLWRQFNLLVGALSGEANFSVAREHLALPALGSFLWDPASTAALNDSDLTNHDFLEALRELAFTRQEKVLWPVDYKNLGAEELGGVYESLLTLTPQIGADGARFTFAEFAGNERKLSGSYYTPDSLVQCLLDSALDPVVEEAIKGKSGTEAEKAILALKVCDPAVGSGHFLVGAAHRLARHLARVRALTHGDSEPSPLLYQHALRDVIGRCLYGVDVRPMAAELCRVGLWLEALEPGKPLSFLDHHIRVGNSLLGGTPEVIAAGIPDEAFTAIEGDDRKACAVLKKRNKSQRSHVGPLLAQQDAETQARLEQAAAALEELPDDRPEEIRVKELVFRRPEQTEEYRQKKRLADTWCAAFVIRKQFREPGRESSASGITQGDLNSLADGRPLPVALVREVERLAGQYQFFHWHLAFPEVFAHGGFNCVLGNPPWEKVELLQREWFGGARPDLNTIPAGTEKETFFQELRVSDPRLYEAFIDATRTSDGERGFIQHSGRYPLCGQGRINSYAAFAETNLQILGHEGIAGCVLPPGIATDDSTKFFIQHVVENELLKSFFAFTNRGYIFPDIESTLSFALITYGRKKSSSLRLAAQLWQVEHLSDEGRIYALDRQTIRRINPNTLNLPILQNSKDALLVSDIHRRIPVLQDENVHDGAAARVEFRQGLFNMTTDKKHFESLENMQMKGFTLTGNVFLLGQDARFLPLYEAKFTSQFNHRHGTFDHVPQSERFGTRAQTNKPRLEDLQNPNWSILPRYWVDEKAVDDAIPTNWKHPWFLGFRNAISAVADFRSVAFSVIPRAAVGNSMPLLFAFGEPFRSALLLANFNAFMLDYVCRQKASGGNLNFYVVKQLPILPSFAYNNTFPWLACEQTLRDWILPRAAWDLQPFAQDCGWPGSPFRWDEERRFHLRCELDATFFHLYLGPESEWRQRPEALTKAFPKPRDAVFYIMDTFPIVKRKDEERFNGEYRTKRVILEIYDAMDDSIRAGRPYQTRLDPPPGDPRCCHPPRNQDVTVAV